MALSAGKLRHRVDIQLPELVQDPVTGEAQKVWVTRWFKVFAGIEYVSVKDMIAAQAQQSKVTARITIRYRSGLSSDMRLIHNGTVFTPAGWLPDSDSGMEYVVIPCSQGIVQVN